ncbi:hypothetical protein C8F04DRAFT_1263012 [Mycena alexandri]|uniref:Uncharacterized protein n=1 Tax=Mycena alexandri TaxID=1745969 RepID=A0AAD6SPU5_9AGAR|nr:hypothetical protein C8F04DRAFT_1263012 [Mycena alexandri]
MKPITLSRATVSRRKQKEEDASNTAASARPQDPAPTRAPHCSSTASTLTCAYEDRGYGNDEPQVVAHRRRLTTGHQSCAKDATKARSRPTYAVRTRERPQGAIPKLEPYSIFAARREYTGREDATERDVVPASHPALKIAGRDLRAGYAQPPPRTLAHPAHHHSRSRSPYGRAPSAHEAWTRRLWHSRVAHMHGTKTHAMDALHASMLSRSHAINHDIPDDARTHTQTCAFAGSSVPAPLPAPKKLHDADVRKNGDVKL